MSDKKSETIIPADLARHRFIGAAEAAALCNLSLAHWRRLYQTGKAPAPIKLSERKLGWRVGARLDWMDAAPRRTAA